MAAAGGHLGDRHNSRGSGEAAEYVDLDNSNDIAAVIRRHLQRTVQENEAVTPVDIERYTWDRATRKLADILRSIVTVSSH